MLFQLDLRRPEVIHYVGPSEPLSYYGTWARTAAGNGNEEVLRNSITIIHEIVTNWRKPQVTALCTCRAHTLLSCDKKIWRSSLRRGHEVNVTDRSPFVKTASYKPNRSTEASNKDNTTTTKECGWYFAKQILFKRLFNSPSLQLSVQWYDSQLIWLTSVEEIRKKDGQRERKNKEPTAVRQFVTSKCHLSSLAATEITFNPACLSVE